MKIKNEYIPTKTNQGLSLSLKKERTHLLSHWVDKLLSLSFKNPINKTLAYNAFFNNLNFLFEFIHLSLSN